MNIISDWQKADTITHEIIHHGYDWINFLVSTSGNEHIHVDVRVELAIHVNHTCNVVQIVHVHVSWLWTFSYKNEHRKLLEIYIYLNLYSNICREKATALCLIHKLIKMYNRMCNNSWSTTMESKRLYLYLSYSINLLALSLKYVLPICNH